jgi:hypothetical protein
MEENNEQNGVEKRATIHKRRQSFSRIAGGSAALTIYRGDDNESIKVINRANDDGLRVVSEAELSG